MEDELNAPPATRAEITWLASLSRGRERREHGALLVEGATLVEEAARAGLAVQLVAATEEAARAHAALVERCADAGARIVTLADHQAERVSDRQTGTGLLAAVALPAPWDRTLPAVGPVLVLALAGLQDPGNVGTLLRGARAFRAHAVVLLPGCADPAAPKVVRASAGAAFAVPWTAVDGPEALAALAADVDLAVVSAQSPGRDGGESGGSPPDALADRCLLVLGHETRGVPPITGARTVRIAQEADAESINVAMAGSILLSRWYDRYAS